MGLGSSKNSNVSSTSVAISDPDYTHTSSLLNVNGKTDYRGITTGNAPPGLGGMFENGLFGPVTAGIVMISMIMLLATVSLRYRRNHARQNINFARAGTETRQLVELNTI